MKKNILVLLLGGIGDSIMATPALTLLRKAYPQAIISVLARDKPTKTIMERNKDVDTVLHYPFMKSGYVKSLLYVLKLRKHHYDLSILTYPANRFQHNVISFLIGAKKRIAHSYPIKKLTSLNFLNTQRLPTDIHKHPIDENIYLLSLLGIQTKTSLSTSFPITPEEQAVAKNYLKQQKITTKHFLVGIHAGSSEMAGMANKRWPKEKFAALADKLVEEKKATILLFGGPAELALNQQIQSLMKYPAYIADHTLPLLPALYLVNCCHLFITNDSLFMNVAVHYNLPTVVTSGHLDPRKYAPRNKHVRYLVPETNCCFYKVGEDLTCKYKGTPRYCLNQISVDMAYKAALGVIR